MIIVKYFAHLSLLSVRRLGRGGGTAISSSSSSSSTSFAPSAGSLSPFSSLFSNSARRFGLEAPSGCRSEERLLWNGKKKLEKISKELPYFWLTNLKVLLKEFHFYEEPWGFIILYWTFYHFHWNTPPLSSSHFTFCWSLLFCWIRFCINRLIFSDDKFLWFQGCSDIL